MDGSLDFTVDPCEKLSSEAYNSKFSMYFQNPPELALCWLYFYRKLEDCYFCEQLPESSRLSYKMSEKLEKELFKTLLS